MMNKFSTIVCLFSALFIAGLQSGCQKNKTSTTQDLALYEVNVNLSTNNIHIGELIDCNIEVLHPQGTEIQLPEIAQGKNIVIRDRNFERIEAVASNVITRVQYNLTSFRIGDFALSTNEVQILHEDGTRSVTPFPDTWISVLSTLSSTNDAPADILPPVEIPFAIPKWLILLSITSALAIIMGVLAWYFLGRKEAVLPPPPPPPPAHLRALADLKKLREAGLIEQLEVEPFFIRLSDIVRNYLEDRFNLSAPEMTTEEFMRETAQSSVLKVEHQNVTQDFLIQSDLIKFAKKTASIEEMNAFLNHAEKLVHETIESQVNS